MLTVLSNRIGDVALLLLG